MPSSFPVSLFSFIVLRSIFVLTKWETAHYKISDLVTAIFAITIHLKILWPVKSSEGVIFRRRFVAESASSKACVKGKTCLNWSTIRNMKEKIRQLSLKTTPTLSHSHSPVFLISQLINQAIECTIDDIAKQIGHVYRGSLYLVRYGVVRYHVVRYHLVRYRLVQSFQLVSLCFIPVR
jgi:hypothetical protein